MTIHWSLIDTALGRALVAATQRGVCMDELGEDDAALEAKLQAEFPAADRHRVDAGRDEFLAPRVRAVADGLAGKQATADGAADLSVDLVGTAFQKRVWDALMRIPPGQTRSYAELAAELGDPRAARAVAGACARNRVAVIVPCHRVIRGDGSLGGYRWGLPLKRKVLQRERST
jgi:AraC family transcriptional regulator of adaptative response/methylated-DNA-[protein]-cysteine methyltransferase